MAKTQVHNHINCQRGICESHLTATSFWHGQLQMLNKNEKKISKLLRILKILVKCCICMAKSKSGKNLPKYRKHKQNPKKTKKYCYICRNRMKQQKFMPEHWPTFLNCPEKCRSNLKLKIISVFFLFAGVVQTLHKIFKQPPLKVNLPGSPNKEKTNSIELQYKCVRESRGV